MIQTERTEYLQLCKECSLLNGGIHNIKENVPNDLKVIFAGNVFYPVGYKLRFDNRGNPLHIAILHDLHANSITEAELLKVEQYNHRKELQQ